MLSIRMNQITLKSVVWERISLTELCNYSNGILLPSSNSYTSCCEHMNAKCTAKHLIRYKFELSWCQLTKSNKAERIYADEGWQQRQHAWCEAPHGGSHHSAGATAGDSHVIRLEVQKRKQQRAPSHLTHATDSGEFQGSQEQTHHLEWRTHTVVITGALTKPVTFAFN